MTIANDVAAERDIQAWRSWARSAAWLSTACFVLGWVVFFGMKRPFGVLCWVAGAQAGSGVA